MAEQYTKLCEDLLHVGMYEELGESSTAICYSAVDAIESLLSENMDFYFKLTAVMLSVDKWLDGKELEQDEASRAVTMREKTLQIVEKLQAELDAKDKRIEELEIELERTQREVSVLARLMRNWDEEERRIETHE